MSAGCSHADPDLSIFCLFLKCWPHDGGRFITLPIVHTIHPVTGKTNVGMYRMQVLDKNTTAMHWQRHKTGANHFEAWKAVNTEKCRYRLLWGEIPYMPTLQQLPCRKILMSTFCAGFLRKKRSQAW